MAGRDVGLSPEQRGWQKWVQQGGQDEKVKWRLWLPWGKMGLGGGGRMATIVQSKSDRISNKQARWCLRESCCSLGLQLKISDLSFLAVSKYISILLVVSHPPAVLHFITALR